MLGPNRRRAEQLEQVRKTNGVNLGVSVVAGVPLLQNSFDYTADSAMFWAEIVGSGTVSPSGSGSILGSLEAGEIDGDTRAYTWVERVPGETRGGTWRNGPRSGTLNAYQVEPQLGLTPTRVVSPGSIVIMWQSSEQGTYNFVPILPGVDAGQPLQLDLLVGLCDNKTAGSGQGSLSDGLGVECPTGFSQQWSFTLSGVTNATGTTSVNRTWTLALGANQWTETFDTVTATLEISDSFYTLTFSWLGILAVYQFEATPDDCCSAKTLTRIFDSSSDGYSTWPTTITLTPAGGCEASSGPVSPVPALDSGGPGLDLIGLTGIYQRIELPPGTRDLGRYCKPIVACGPKDCTIKPNRVPVCHNGETIEVSETLTGTITAFIASSCSAAVGLTFTLNYIGQVNTGTADVHRWMGGRLDQTTPGGPSSSINVIFDLPIPVTSGACGSVTSRISVVVVAGSTNPWGASCYSPNGASLSYEVTPTIVSASPLVATVAEPSVITVTISE